MASVTLRMYLQLQAAPRLDERSTGREGIGPVPGS